MQKVLVVEDEFSYRGVFAFLESVTGAFVACLSHFFIDARLSRSPTSVDAWPDSASSCFLFGRSDVSYLEH